MMEEHKEETAKAEKVLKERDWVRWTAPQGWTSFTVSPAL